MRRNPIAGLALLAMLIPLIAAGPAMPCATDAGHHEAAGHAAHGSMSAGEHASHGHASAGGHHPEPDAAPVPDDAPAPSSPASCTMGMLCSGTVVTPTVATLSSAAVVHELPGAERRWTLHTADPTLPRRPPRA